MQKNKGKLIVLAGASGVGKSTFAHNKIDGYVVCPDTWRKVLYGDESEQKNHALVFRMVDKEIRSALRQGQTVISDQTSLTTKALFNATRLAEQEGVEVELIFINSEIEELFQGQKDRSQAGGRKVDDEVIKKQFNMAKYLNRAIQSQEIEGFTKISVIDRKTAGQIPSIPQKTSKRQDFYQQFALNWEFRKLRTQVQDFLSKLVEEGKMNSEKDYYSLSGILGTVVEEMMNIIKQINYKKVKGEQLHVVSDLFTEAIRLSSQQNVEL